MLLASVSGLENLGEYDPTECVNIRQSCPDCTFVNASITYPNSSIAVANVTLSSVGSGGWIYQFCTTNLKGRYDVFGIGDPNGTIDEFATYFLIGKQAPTGESLLYLVFVILLSLSLLVLFYFIFVLPAGNERDSRGFEKKIVKLKYIRVFFMSLAYGILVVLLNLLNGLAVQFTSFSIFAGTLGFLFEVALRIAWPVYIVLFIWVGYMLIHDSNVNRIISRIGGGQFG